MAYNNIPVNRVANNLVISHKEKNEYMGLFIPIVSPAQLNAMPVGNVIGGAPIQAVATDPTHGYYTVLNLNRTFQTHAPVWEQIVTCPIGASGAGLTSGMPIILPAGPAASVEVLGNQVFGFTYRDTTAGQNNRTRTYNGQGGTGWQTLPAA